MLGTFTSAAGSLDIPAPKRAEIGRGKQAVLNLNSTVKSAERAFGAGWGCWALSLQRPAFRPKKC